MQILVGLCRGVSLEDILFMILADKTGRNGRTQASYISSDSNTVTIA